jgi:integrase
MASLYQRARSPFWWIKFRDPRSGRTIQESTGFKHGVGADTRRARELCAERTLAERKSARESPQEGWDQWVGDYLRVRYQGKPQSLLRYQIAWRMLRLFLDERGVNAPRYLTRAHCVDFVSWRQSNRPGDRRRGKYRAGHNTAHLEIKTLGLIMREAVLRGYAPFNPCRELDIKRVPGAEKPEFTDEELAFIEEKIAAEPEPTRTILGHSFRIARFHGVRISETYLNPMTAVVVKQWASDGSIAEATITFRTKGNRTHCVGLHHKLFGLFSELIRDKQAETYPKAKSLSLSKLWFNFLTRIGIKKTKPKACFHSLRVTAASKLARSNTVQERDAMRYIGHASVTVHRSYVRHRHEALPACEVALD